MLVAAGSLFVWHFWDGRGGVLKPDGGPVADAAVCVSSLSQNTATSTRCAGAASVTVMDFGQSFPLDPLPSGLETPKILDAHTDDDGLHGQGRGAEHAVRDP